MMQTKMKIRKDDKVKIVTGKDKGKIGKVLKIDNQHSRVLVENINIIKRHSRPSAQNRQGGILGARNADLAAQGPVAADEELVHVSRARAGQRRPRGCGRFARWCAPRSHCSAAGCSCRARRVA